MPELQNNKFIIMQNIYTIASFFAKTKEESLQIDNRAPSNQPFKFIT